MAQELKIENLDMDQLMELKTRIEERIQSLAKSELQALEEKMSKLQSYIGDGRGKRRKDAGTKAPPKFRDPKSGKTWSGRGQTPVWLRELEAKGKRREEYAI